MRQRLDEQVENEPQAIVMDSPFNLRSVFGLAGFIAAVMVFSQLAARFFGASGTYVIAALSALADVDAIALLLARQAYRELSVEVATVGIGIAVAVNTITKAGMAMIMGTAAVERTLRAISSPSSEPSVRSSVMRSTWP